MAKKKVIPIVSCMSCKKATLMQWFKNPIISECSVNGERHVAGMEKRCEWYAADNNQKQIIHYDKYD